MTAAAESYTLKCKCGAFEATLTGPPKVIFNCHCHSCVAVIKAIEDRDGFSGTSIKSTNEGGSGDNNDYKGAAVAIYKSNNTTINKVDESKIGFMKVGENGKSARPYCTECGTVLFNAFLPNWCAANRNAMTKTGTTEEEGLFTPSSPVYNVNCKHAFVPSDIPSPKHSTVPFGMLFKFIPLLTGFRCDGSHKNDKALVPEDMSQVEACPITWD